MCTLARHDAQPWLCRDLLLPRPTGRLYSNAMADLEKLAIRRDRGYLIRLILSLAVGVVISAFVFQWLTGADVSGCIARTIGGEPAASEPAT